MHAVLRYAGRSRTGQVARHNQIDICTAHAARGLRRDTARAHVADAAARAGQAERALRLLRVEAVERRVDAQLVRAPQHLGDSRVGRLLYLVLLRGERLTVCLHGIRVVLDERAAALFGVALLMVGLMRDHRHAVLVEPDEVAMRVDVRRRRAACVLVSVLRCRHGVPLLPRRAEAVLIAVCANEFSADRLGSFP